MAELYGMMKNMLDLSHLNRKQKTAVTHGEGPVLIVAGAGTGKTTVITHRLAYLVEKKKIKPEEILALTFTDKAATEMAERVDQLLSRGYADLWISTFHSFAERILKEHGLDIGLPTDFKLVDQTAAWLLVRQNLDRFKLDYYRPIGQPTKFIHALVSHFSRCKDQAIYPEDYLAYSQKDSEDKETLVSLGRDKETLVSLGRDKERLKEIASAYETYQKLLLGAGLLDFGDLINYCLRLFQKRPQILEKYRQQFKYVLVDEFQDTNWVQYELVKLLAAPKNNLTVCADDDQSIYKFRGASFSNIVQFKKDFPKAQEVVLIENYRSRQNILDSAYQFIQANNPNRLEHISRIDKNLKAAKKGKGKIGHLHFKSGEQEVSGVLEKIIELLREDKEATFSDFAILVRANHEAPAFIRGLERSNIPYQFMAMRGLYAKPVILDIVSYFKFLDNYHESSAAFRILNLPFLNLLAEDIAQITRYSSRRSKSIFESLQELSLIPGLSQLTINGVNRILSLVKKHTAQVLEKNVSEILLSFLEDSGYLEYLVKKEKKEDLDLISQFHSRIKSFEESHLDSRLRIFMEELNLELESGEEGKMNFDIEQGPAVVKIMTLHSAKGLEFKYTFLVNLVDKRFPSLERKEPIEIPEELIKDIPPEGDFHLQEERRLFYVGMTRAKDGLFLTSAEDYGGVTRKRLSRFLIELGYDQALTPLKSRTVRVNQKKFEKIKEFLLPERFSFTQLAAFEKCPLQYKFAHILKIPVKGKSVFSFGKTIHNTLQGFLLASTLGPVGLKDLLEIYQREWLDEWYESQTQKQEYFELGRKTLERFYQNFAQTKPQLLFLKGHPALEQDFNIKIGGHTLIGKIDRIDDKGDGVEIIDYKTGSAKERLRPEDKKQLLIYQMATEEALGLKPQKLTYYYLDEGKSLSFLGSRADIEKEKKEIVDEIEQIKRSDFAPTPGWQCDWCDFKNICEFAKKNNN